MAASFAVGTCLLGLIAMAFAQSDTVADGTTLAAPFATVNGWVFPMTMPGSMTPAPHLASLIAADLSQTTLALTCAPGTMEAECNSETPLTMTLGSSTFRYTQAAFGQKPLVVSDCKLSTGGAHCTATYVSSVDDNPPETVTRIYSADELLTSMMIVTAGQYGRVTIGSVPPTATRKFKSGVKEPVVETGTTSTMMGQATALPVVASSGYSRIPSTITAAALTVLLGVMLTE